ncbi:ATP-binding protein [Corynebacterium amycolatum]|uniref:sensor histidine kinase n=1 Tax=Corynebacterium amycolatum TaxID=43765 RepID=UPI003EDF4D5D
MKNNRGTDSSRQRSTSGSSMGAMGSMGTIQRALARQPLRRALLVLLAVTLATGLVLSAIAVTLTVRAQLLEDVDNSLLEASHHWVKPQPDSPRGGAPLQPAAPGQPTPDSPAVDRPSLDRPPSPFYVQLYSEAGAVLTTINDSTSTPDFSLSLNNAASSANGGDDSGDGQSDSQGDSRAEWTDTAGKHDAEVAAQQPFTVNSTDGSGSWRVIVLPAGSSEPAPPTSATSPDSTADSDAATTPARVVIAMPLEQQVYQTIKLLIIVQVACGIPVLLLLIVASSWIIRRWLQPLKDIETAAGDIAAGRFDVQVPEQPVSTEIGSLSRSFNYMAGQLDEAFTQASNSEQAARESERRMRQFVADAGHELRTPVTSVRGFSQLYQQGAIEAEPAMEMIYNESGRMKSLIEDLLSLAHFDSARPIADEPVDLATVINDCAASARASYPNRNIAVRIDADPRPSGDEARLRQAVANLVTNACVHTPDTANISIALDADGTNAVITVSDTGPGIPAADQGRVFQRFERLDQSRSRHQGGGSGLGLAIVREIIAAHGGTITLDSRTADTSGADEKAAHLHDHGCVFTIRLPL